MSKELERIAQRMADDGSKTLAYFRSLSPQDWDQQVYTTGSKWAVGDILAHFVSAERAFRRLLEDVTGGGEGAPADFDIDAFNESQVREYRQRSVVGLLEDFRAARQQTLDLARRLNEADLSRRGYHPWFGRVEVRQMLKLVYRHNMIHLRDVRRALREGAPVPHLEVTPPSRGQE